MVLAKFNLNKIRRLFRSSRSTIYSSISSSIPIPIPNVRSRDSVSSSPIPSSYYYYVAHQASTLRYMSSSSSVLTNNSPGVTLVPPSSSTSNTNTTTTTTTTTMVGPLIFRHDPGRWICSMNIHGVHFVSGKSVLDYFLQTLASVVGSIEEAKKRIYFVSCEWNCFYFGANIDEQTSMKLEDVPGVDFVLEDNHFDARNKFAAVRSIPKFFPLNWGHRLVDMSRYHESSKLNMERDQDPGHWLIKIREPADGFSAAEEVVDSCINLLAAVVGRKEAIKKIYAVWCNKPYGFGAEIDMGTLKKLKELPNLECFPDHAFDVKNDFGILVIGNSACPNSSSPAGLHYWPLDDTYGSCEEVINSDEDSLDSDEDSLNSDDDGYHYDEEDLESDSDNLKSDDLVQSIC